MCTGVEAISNLPAATPTKRTIPMASGSSARDEASWAPPLSMMECWLAWSQAGNHSCCGFRSTTARAVSGNRVTFSSPSSNSCSFCSLFQGVRTGVWTWPSVALPLSSVVLGFLLPLRPLQYRLVDSRFSWWAPLFSLSGWKTFCTSLKKIDTWANLGDLESLHL